MSAFALGAARWISYSDAGSMADEIDRIHAFYKCKVGLVRNLGQRAPNDADFRRHVDFPDHVAIAAIAQNEREIEITTTVKELREHIEETTFLALMAAFERALFIRIGSAAGAIKQLVDSGYTGTGRPMSRFRRGFIKDLEHFGNLGGAADVLGHGPLESELMEDFTEEKQGIDMQAIKAAVAEAEVIVFLGFAFHPINMELRQAGGEPSPLKRVYATTYQMSNADSGAISQKIQKLVPTSFVGAGNVQAIQLIDGTCADLFQKYTRELAQR